MGSCHQCSLERFFAKYAKKESVVFETIAGSKAYGTDVPTSDTDIRGIYMLPPSEYLGLEKAWEQASDEKSDILYYNLKRFFELLNTANPNLIELLWMPDECIRIKDPVLDPLFEARGMFLTKKAYYSHAKYAAAQIKKARGQNKRVHNPQPKERPSREDFCYVIGEDKYRDGYANYNYGNDMVEKNDFPFRPIQLKEIQKSYWQFDLSKCHVAAMEHMSNTYRLYHYRDAAKGVFRGKDQMLVCESIPKEDEWHKFLGLLIYNEDAYEKAVKEWDQYWEWMNNRNEARWVDQETGNLDYDQKNMMHCIRLLWSAESIALNGSPIVRFEGEKLETLRSIRSGNFEYNEILELSEEILKSAESAFGKADLPDKIDAKKANELYLSLKR